MTVEQKKAIAAQILVLFNGHTAADSSELLTDINYHCIKQSSIVGTAAVDMKVFEPINYKTILTMEEDGSTPNPKNLISSQEECPTSA